VALDDGLKRTIEWFAHEGMTAEWLADWIDAQTGSNFPA
jgi:hypothetical protein